MTRRALPVVCLALVVAACSGDFGTGPDAPPADTAATPVPGSATLPEGSDSDAVPVDPDLVPDPDPDLLAALVFFPGEVPAPYDDLAFDPVDSGFSPAGGSLGSAIDPRDEADDIVRFGQVAEFSTAYGDPNEVGVAFNASQFATAAGAEAYLTDWEQDLRSAASEPGNDRFTLGSFRSEAVEGLADQAIRVGYTGRLTMSDGTVRDRPGGAVVVRRGALAMWVWGNGEPAEQILDDLGPAVAERVVGVADGDIPPRDHTLLGLTDPPTLALESFAFTYSYGIEADEGGFTVDVEGLYRGPGRASCRTTTTIGGFEAVDSYVVADGARIWLGDQTGYRELTLRDPGALNALTGCPAHPNHWEITRLHRIEVSGGVEVTISGVAALRKDLADDSEALAAVGILADEMDEFTRYELAVAADGGWPISLDVERRLPIEAALRLYGLPSAEISDPAAPALAFERLLLTRIDDPSIVVELPLLAG